MRRVRVAGRVPSSIMRRTVPRSRPMTSAVERAEMNSGASDINHSAVRRGRVAVVMVTPSGVRYYDPTITTVCGFVLV